MAVFGGKEVTIAFKETKTVELKGKIIEETAEGITVRHTYRKGKRLEFIPRDKLESIFLDEEKPARKPRKAKEAKPKQEIVVEADVTVEGTVEPTAEPVVEEEDTDDNGIFSETGDFDDSGEFDDDDEFE
jgi:hypothetical protein